MRYRTIFARPGFAGLPRFKSMGEQTLRQRTIDIVSEREAFRGEQILFPEFVPILFHRILPFQDGVPDE